jgi:glycosyltransferase involved in cell wall biosynthesis
MQDKSLVIICLCYNQENYVIESLQFINQDYKLIELIIVDDYSTDNSKSVIEEFIDYPEIQFIANETNLGTKSFNKSPKDSQRAYH